MKQVLAGIVGAVLLLVGSEAGAGCAWVLWAHWGGGMVRTPDGGLHNPFPYQPMGAYQSKEECESVKRSWKLPAGYDHAVCLPDTVKVPGAGA
jgi:hypothetical protein